jgi:hypothetical protein
MQYNMSSNPLNNLEQCDNNKCWRLWNANFNSKNELNMKFDKFKSPEDIANNLAVNVQPACSPNSSVYDSEQLTLYKSEVNATLHSASSHPSYHTCNAT